MIKKTSHFLRDLVIANCATLSVSCSAFEFFVFHLKNLINLDWLGHRPEPIFFDPPSVA
jgi:hypothetical protein